jgi:hypothetical protein
MVEMLFELFVGTVISSLPQNSEISAILTVPKQQIYV